MRVFSICSIFILACLLTVGVSLVYAETSIYAGQPASDAGITFGPWGSGLARQDTEKTLTGSTAIKVETGGWFQGGSIEFEKPAVVFTGKPGANDYLVFVVSPTMLPGMSSDSSDNSWYTNGSATASKSYDFGAESVQKPKIQRMRFIFTDDKDNRQEIQQSLTPSSDTGWMDVTIPLTKIKLAAGASGYSLKKMLVFSDVPDTIYIGAIKVTQDTLPITVETGGGLSYATGDAVPFEATVMSGISNVKCTWDFDDKDGIQEDAIGAYVSHVFTAAGDYVATVTAADANGIKASKTATVKVHIE